MRIPALFLLLFFSACSVYTIPVGIGESKTSPYDTFSVVGTSLNVFPKKLQRTIKHNYMFTRDTLFLKNPSAFPQISFLEQAGYDAKTSTGFLLYVGRDWLDTTKLRWTYEQFFIEYDTLWPDFFYYKMPVHTYRQAQAQMSADNNGLFGGGILQSRKTWRREIRKNKQYRRRYWRKHSF